METIKVTITELYELRALLDGFAILRPSKVEGESPTKEVLYTGLIHEKGVTEGTKRQALRAKQVINRELESIEAQRKDIQAYTEEGLSEEGLKAKIAQKDRELLAEAIEISVEKMDFQRLEDLSLSMDYGVLYEKLFK